MSLAINVDQVYAVLLADGWHECDMWKDGRSSFMLDAYGYTEPREGKDPFICLGGGVEKLVPATGFCFEESHVRVCGPITAILAVKEV